MGYRELQVRWMYSKLPETKAEVLKPLLPPESILLTLFYKEDVGTSMVY